MLIPYLIITGVVAVFCLCVSGIMAVDATEADERVSRKFALGVVASPLWPVAALLAIYWMLKVFARHVYYGFLELFEEMKR